MRVLVLTLSNPWAVQQGGTMRYRAFAEALAQCGHEVFVGYWGDDPPAAHPGGIHSLSLPTAAVGMRAWPDPIRRAKRVLFPAPTSLGAAGSSVRGLLHLAPVDILLVGQLQLARHAKSLGAKNLWLDFSDVLSGLAQVAAADRRGLPRWTGHRQASFIAGAERRAASAAALVTTAGWGDRQKLQAGCGCEVAWLPTPIKRPAEVRRSATRPTAGFLADFRYGPNRDALHVLRGWVPCLRASGWDVLTAGLDSDSATPPEIRTLGAIEEVAEFYREVDVTLAPLRRGGGMKVKVIESLAHGRPVVATPFAVEGFPPEIRDAVYVVDPIHPDLSGLDRTAALPASLGALLKPFSFEAFQAEVERLLRPVASGVTPHA